MDREQLALLRKLIQKEREKLAALSEKALKKGGSLSDPAVLRQAAVISDLTAKFATNMPLSGSDAAPASSGKEKREEPSDQ